MHVIMLNRFIIREKAKYQSDYKFCPNENICYKIKNKSKEYNPVNYFQGEYIFSQAS